MKRVLSLVVMTALLLVALVSATGMATGGCNCETTNTSWKAKTVKFGISVGGVYKNLIGASIGLTFELTKSVTFKATCHCKDCDPLCSKCVKLQPNNGEVEVTAMIPDTRYPIYGYREEKHQVIAFYSGEEVTHTEECNDLRTCDVTKEITVTHLTSSLGLAVSAGVGPISVSWENQEISGGAQFTCKHECENSACLGKPLFSSYPTLLHIPRGGEVTFDITAHDPDLPNDELTFEHSSPAGVSVELKAGKPLNKSVTVHVTVNCAPTYTPSADQKIHLEAVDKCGNEHDVTIHIPFTVISFPKITAGQPEIAQNSLVWCSSNCGEKPPIIVRIQLTDPNHDKDASFRVQVHATGGNAYIGGTPSDAEVMASSELNQPLPIRFCPNADAAKGSITVEVTNLKYGVSKSLTVPIDVCKIRNDHSPQIKVRGKEEVKVKQGEEIRKAISATDADCDEIELSKVSGPGTLEVEGKAGRVSGTYRWTALGYNPWKLVGFKATDPCGGADHAYLLIHILQPPHVGNGYVSVFQGKTAVNSIYVEDPDSDKLSFSFDSPDGITVKGVAEEPVLGGLTCSRGAVI